MRLPSLLLSDMEYTATKFAEILLKVKAVQLNISNPYTWASGLRAPIYCDNRILLAYPAYRKAICHGFAALIKTHFPGIDGIAGVATAGIPHAAWLADALELPLVYIRSEAKKHGRGNQIEGVVEAGKQYIIIEDLISTGKSSLLAVEALQGAGATAKAVLGIFSYGFPFAEAAFAERDIPLFTLTNFEALLAEAKKSAYISASDQKELQQWSMDPVKWSEQYSK